LECGFAEAVVQIQLQAHSVGTAGQILLKVSSHYSFEVENGCLLVMQRHCLEPTTPSCGVGAATPRARSLDDAEEYR
jgi:hypothetical protein